MNGEQLGRALQEHKGLTSIHDVELADADHLDADGYDFVGVRSYWGSMVSCAVLTAQSEDVEFIRERKEEFYRFSRSLRPLAGSVSGARLGAFGMLVVMAHSPTSREFRRAVRRLRHGSAWHKDYCVTWLIDVPGQAVLSHRGLPFVMFPGRKFFVQQLASGCRLDNIKTQQPAALRAAAERHSRWADPHESH